MSTGRTGVAGQVGALLELPGVAEAVERARTACTELRWHQALRRRIPEAAAESRVRGAAASALLEGAEVAGSRGSLAVLRDIMRGAGAWTEPLGPVERTAKAAVQVTAATEFVDAAALRSPAQVLARLHVAAGADLLPAEQVGRPRLAGEECREAAELGPAPSAAEVVDRMMQVNALLRALDAGASTLVVGALVHAEIATVRPFVRGNLLVARALERAVVRAGGLDPTGVAVVESGHGAKVGADYRGALTAYGHGGVDGVRLWLQHCAEGIETACAEGVRIADAVLAGRITSGEPAPAERPGQGGQGLPKSLL